MPKNILLKIALKGAKKSARGLTKVGGAIKGLSKISGVAGIAVAGLSVKLAGDFSKSLAEVSTLMGHLTEKEMKNMSKELRVLSQTSGLALSSLSKAKYDIVSAGFASAAESAQVLAASTKLAVGGVTSAAAAADIITTSLNSYNLSSKKAEEISDSLFTTVRLGKTTMDELSLSLGNVLPVAKSAGLSFDSVGAAMASLTANGIDTAVSTTALRGAIIALTAPTDGARIAMEKAGIEAKRFEDGTFDLLETVKQFEGLSPDLLRQYIPDIRATIAISSLANNIDGLSDNLDAFADKTGATSKSFRIMAGEFNTQMAMLRNTTQSIMIEIGGVIIDAILPSITEANDELAKLGEIGWDVVAQRLSENMDFITNILTQSFEVIGANIAILGQEAWMELPFFMGGPDDAEAIENIERYKREITDRLAIIKFDIGVLKNEIGEPIDITNWFSPEDLKFDNDVEIFPDSVVENIDGVIVAVDDAGKAFNKMTAEQIAMSKAKEDALKKELRQAALVQGSAKDAMKAVVRAESMEAVAGLISSILKSVPFPWNLVAAAGAGGLASSLIDKGLSQFAKGGDFVTSGPQMIMVGDNPGGKERVQVTPLGSPNVNGPQGGININFSGPITNDDYVRDFIIPEITKATRLNLA